MCDFISDKNYLKSTKKWSRPEIIPIFFRVHRFISGPLQAKYSIQRCSIMENNKVKALEIYASVIQTNPEYAE